MHYKVFCDDTLIHDGFSPLNNVHLLNPVLKISDNKAGTFNFTIPTNNIGYDLCEKFKSTIYIYKENDLIWAGRIISETMDFWNQRKCTAEGALSYLNDTNPGQVKYIRDAENFVSSLLEAHNSRMPTNRQILPGIISIDDLNDNHEYITDYKSTLSEINDHIVSRLGGHIKIHYRSSDRMAIMDYSMDYSEQIEQTIEFGYNLIDFTRSWDLSNLITVVIPRGKKPENQDQSTSTENTFLATLIDETVDYRVDAVYKEKRVNENLSEVSVSSIIIYSNESNLYDITVDLKIGDNPNRIETISSMNANSNKSLSSFKESFNYNKVDTIKSINAVLKVSVEDTSSHKKGTKTNTTIITIPIKESEKTISENVKDYLTVASVNSNSIYVINNEACATYGRIERVVDFNDVDDPDTLLQLAEIYLENTQFDTMSLSINAIDLNVLNPDIDSFNLLDTVLCVSPVHGLNKVFPITEVELPLDALENTKYFLGNSTSGNSLSSRSNLSTNNTNSKISSSASNTAEIILEKVDNMLLEYAHIYDGKIDNAQIDHAKVADLNANYAHISDGVIDNAKIYYADVDELEAHYAHITNGLIDSAYIDQARVNNLSSNYAHISDGVIDNATIDHADVNDLSANYAHISEGLIDNALIGYANVYDLENHYAHIQDGVIDNATIDHADVNGLSANYASIVNGVISNATIDQADVNDLSANYAHITNGVIDNADINYAKVRDLNAHYALIDMSNTNNAWISNGVIRDASITDAMILGVSANKITAGTIDAGVIRVVNLNADNITAGTLNGQILGAGTVDLSALSDDIYTQDDIDDIIETINSRIDSSIQTFTGDVVPTLLNYPASDWDTNDIKSTHIGDVYYVANPSLSENGYAYRFSEINGSYSWELISDNDVTATLVQLNNLQDRIVIIEQFDNTISSWKTSTDSAIGSMQVAHTQLAASVDKAISKTSILWYAKSNLSSPSKPVEHVVNTSTESNKWTKSVPKYDSENPNYFYCYEYEYVDGTYGWSDIVFDNAITDAQSNSSNAIEYSLQLWTIDSSSNIPDSPSDIGFGSDLVYYDTILDSDEEVLIDDINHPYYSELNASIYNYYNSLRIEYIIDSNGDCIVDNIYDPYLTNLRWSIEVPEYQENQPYYFYCWEYHHIDGHVSWSDAVFDKATTDAQRKASELQDTLNYKVDVTVFNEVIQSIDENSATITRLAEIVDDNYTTTTQSINSVRQTSTTNESKISNLTSRLGLNPDGTAGDQDVVSKYSDLQQTVDSFQTTVSETYATKNELDDLVIGGRNLLRFTKDFIESTIQTNGCISNASSQLLESKIYGFGVRYLDMSESSSNVYSTFVEFSNVVVPEINSTYILSFYIKGSGRIKAVFGPSQIGENITAITSRGTISTESDGSVNIIPINTWTRVWVKWLVSGTATSSFRTVSLRLYGGNTAYIYGMKFEEGTKVTAWTPAPEDYEQYAEEYTNEQIATISERLSQAETSIVQNSNSITLKADKTETYTKTQVDNIISQEVSDRSSAIQLANNSILSTVSENYATTNALSGVSNRVSTAETTIIQQSESLLLKADKSDTYTKSDVNGIINKEVSDRNLAIEAGINGLSATVSQTYLSKNEYAQDTDMSSMISSGGNLLNETDIFGDVYFSDSNGYTITDNYKVPFGYTETGVLITTDMNVSSNKYNNLNAIFIDATLYDSKSRTIVDSNNEEIIPIDYTEIVRYNNVLIPKIGSTYIFSFYAKGHGTIHAKMIYPSIEGNISGISSQGNGSYIYDGDTEFTLDADWSRYWVKWTIGGTESEYADICIGINGGSIVTISGLQFEEGTILSAWTPSRNDYIKESIIEAESIFNITADGIRSEVSKKTDKDDIISTINQSAESILISAEKVDIEGAAVFKSLQHEASSNHQYIYYSQTKNVAPGSINGWVTDSSGEQHKWTTVRPKYNKTYPVLWISMQRLSVDGDVESTQPTVDDTTTVIDGGSIITGTINANKLAANELTLGYFNPTVRDKINDVDNMLRRDNFESDYLVQLNDAIREASTTATNYLNYSPQTGELIIGAVTSAIKNVLTNSNQVYRTSTGDIAGFGMFDNRWEMFINTARIGNPIDGTGLLRFNNFQWMSRSNGNMTLKYVES